MGTHPPETNPPNHIESTIWFIFKDCGTSLVGPTSRFKQLSDS